MSAHRPASTVPVSRTFANHDQPCTQNRNKRGCPDHSRVSLFGHSERLSMTTGRSAAFVCRRCSPRTPHRNTYLPPAHQCRLPSGASHRSPLRACYAPSPQGGFGGHAGCLRTRRARPSAHRLAPHSRPTCRRAGLRTSQSPHIHRPLRGCHGTCLRMCRANRSLHQSPHSLLPFALRRFAPHTCPTVASHRSGPATPRGSLTLPRGHGTCLRPGAAPGPALSRCRATRVPDGASNVRSENRVHSAVPL